MRQTVTSPSVQSVHMLVINLYITDTRVKKKRVSGEKYARSIYASCPRAYGWKRSTQRTSRHTFNLFGNLFYAFF